MLYTTPEASFSNGLVERQVDLSKLRYRKANPLFVDLTEDEILPNVALCRNLTPLLNSCLHPLMCMAGRADVFHTLEFPHGREETLRPNIPH